MVILVVLGVVIVVAAGLVVVGERQRRRRRLRMLETSPDERNAARRYDSGLSGPGFGGGFGS